MRDIHKEKCKKLKKIRKSMADKLGVDLHQRECTFEGKCSGTCPKCKQEEEILNKAILQRTAAIGVAATMGVGLVGCNSPSEKSNPMLEELKALGDHKVENIDDSLAGNVIILEDEDENQDDNETNSGYEDIDGGLIELEPTDIGELSGDVEYIGDDFEDGDTLDINRLNIGNDSITGLVVPDMPFGRF